MTATDKDLLDLNKFYVECKWTSAGNDETAKNNLQREYNNMQQKFESGEDFWFEEFLELLDWMQKPFAFEIEGHEVLLTNDDCAIMMETSALCAITQTLFVGKKKHCEDSNSNQEHQNK